MLILKPCDLRLISFGHSIYTGLCQRDGQTDGQTSCNDYKDL